MSVPDILIKYPAVLTNKDWQKKKGPFAKLAGKTGVGETLQACEKAWAAVDWSVFDLDQARKKGRKAVRDGFKVAQAEYKKSVEGLRKALMAASAAADKAAAAFKKNKLIPSSATKAAADISKTAQLMLVATKSIDMKEFEALAARYDRIDKINSYEALRKDKEILKDFLVFAKKEYSLENYMFLEQSEKTKVTEKNAQAVYDAYISSSSKYQLNISNKVRKAYEECMAQKTWGDMDAVMDKVRNEVIGNLLDTLIRFKAEA